MKQTIGIIETKGLISAVAAVDSILKNTIVEFLGFEFIGGGIVISKFSGTSISIDFALKEGREQSEKHGGFIASVSIDLENYQMQKLFSKNKSINSEFLQNETPAKEPSVPVSKNISKNNIDSALEGGVKTISKKSNKISKPDSLVEKHSKEKKQISSEENLFHQSETIERLKREALGTTKKETIKNDFVSGENKNQGDVNNMNVHELRHYVRGIDDFPIKGRQISRASRDELMMHFNSLKR